MKCIAISMGKITGVTSFIIPLGLLFILVTALLLAVHHMPHSVWNDEGLTIDIIHRGNWEDIVRGSMTRKPFPPLFFFLTYAGTQLFDGVFGLRVVSLLFGLLAVVALYWLGKVLLGRWQGLVAAALLASTPGVFFHFVDANPYTIMIFWSALSLGMLVKAIEQDRPGPWMAYSLTVLGGLASHTLFIFILAGQWLYYLHAQLCKAGKWQKLLNVDFWRQQRKFLLSVGLLLLCWMIWVSFYLLNKGLANAPHAEQLFSIYTVLSLIGLIPGPFTYSLWPHGVVFGLLVVAGLIRLWKFDPKTFMGLLLAWIPPIVGITLFVKATLSFISYRYGLGVFPITCLIAASVILPSPGQGSSKSQVLRPALLALCVLLGIMRMALAPSSFFAYSDWIGCNRYLMQVVNPQDQIWFEYDERSFSLQYYYPHPSQIVSCPRCSRDAAVRDLVHRHQQMTATGGRIWMVFPDFQNRNFWIERFTRMRPRQFEENIDEINRQLQIHQGLRLQQDQTFDRIKIYQLVSQ
jgi:4-amino-4-deoxy-L-arabinose transferase-like glycosyltransferase